MTRFHTSDGKSPQLERFEGIATGRALRELTQALPILVEDAREEGFGDEEIQAILLEMIKREI